MSEQYSGWAVIELLGHRIIAGHISEEAIAGGSFVRVDVPDTTSRDGFTKLYGPGAIYAITPCSEHDARMAADNIGAKSIEDWLLIPPTIKEVWKFGYRDNWRDEDDIPF